MGVYVALLRGVNVGGNAKVPMAGLKVCFEDLGFTGVKTFINSGNVIFKADKTSENTLLEQIEACLEKKFGWKIDVVVYGHDRYAKIVKSAPKDWGKDQTWKHNALFMLPPYDIKKVLADIGELKPDIELLAAGDGAVFQSVSWADFGKSRSGKLAGMPIYKRMTVRNYNTTTKLLDLMEQAGE